MKEITITIKQRKYDIDRFPNEIWKAPVTNDIYVNGEIYTSAVGEFRLPGVIKNITEHLYVNNWINA